MTHVRLADDAATLAALLWEASPEHGGRGTVVFSGAGVSTESGIPDFRTPGSGLWTRNAPIDFEDFVSDPSLRRESWRRGSETYAAIAAAEPNAAHRAIGRWWRTGLVSGVVTQNIDGLHQRGGVPADAVAELHGTSHEVGCLACGARYPRSAVEARLAAGDVEPACESCGGILKPATISFGQTLDVATVGQAERWLREASLCLVIGSSLVVYPAAALPEETLRAGGAVAIVNATETHLDPLATLVSRHPAAVLLVAVEAHQARAT